MPLVTWFFVVASALTVMAIAIGVVGREAHRLDAIAPRATYQLDEAVAYVADRLPESSQSRLTHDEVEALLIVHLRWMYDNGLQPDHVVDVRQSDELAVTVSEDDLVATMLATSEDLDVELLDDVDAVHVVDAHLSYFEHIGALGGQVPLDDRL